MKLSDYFSPDAVISDAVFCKTMLPDTSESGSICYAITEKNLRIALENPCISSVIIHSSFVNFPFKPFKEKGIVAVQDPQKHYYSLHNYLIEAGISILQSDHAIHPTAKIAETAVIEKNVVIKENVVVDHYAIVSKNTIIGANSYIGPRVVLGARGMQNLRLDHHKRFPVKWAGGVFIGERCEILAGAIIQKPYHAFYTTIGSDTQISVQVVIGHGVQIGSYTMIAGGSQLAGNVKIGNQVFIGPGSTLADGISIGDKAEVKLGSIVIQNVPIESSISGNFAISHRKHLRAYISEQREKIQN